MFAKANGLIRRRVGYLMGLDLFSDWPAQELAFFARWMTELQVPRMVWLWHRPTAGPRAAAHSIRRPPM